MSSEKKDWQIGDVLKAISSAAIQEHFEGAVIVGKNSQDEWIVQRDDRPPYPYSQEVMDNNFNIDHAARVTDEDVEKARKGLEELLK